MNTKTTSYKPDKTRVTTWIDPQLISQLRAYAALHSMTVSAVIEKLIKQEVAHKMHIEVVTKDTTTYDLEKLDKLAQQAEKESREGKTIILDTPEKLEAYFKELNASV